MLYLQHLVAVVVVMNKRKNLAEKTQQKTIAEAKCFQEAFADDTWREPRRGADRRQTLDPDKTPATGCRRQGDRRKRLYLRADQWWLHRKYSD